MKKQLIVSSIILALATAPVMASSAIEDTDNTSETIGFGTGAIIGGLIAGPIGAVVAGTVGVLIGQSHDRQELIEQADVRLKQNNIAMQSINDEKHNLASLLMQSEQEKLQLSEELASTENNSNNLLSQVEQLEQLKLNLRFDVDSSKVESFYEPQIKHLAMLMLENPELSVNLSGYSDSSGNSASNLALSEARVDSVKSMLVKLGVDEQTIFTEAFGETNSLQANRTKSSDFNDRRVDVQIFAAEQVIEAEQMNETAQVNDLTPLTDVEQLTEVEQFAEVDQNFAHTPHNEKIEALE
ncbi:sortase-associated OmpA-like protein PdsO [Colwellia sp. E2M01]|uniref:sortase-associated OmpA-like protein PdsO n=1 Tax=Colwellia sp. E2M01 TaxID=2841561 RepID=UPI001C082D91|nr:sortase-associated OmpA-like protein PdsO [Colwellia sp. E2M01]MBU2870055.1 sortase-associated OmpA-like protein PdsO [Colwellia sp. E2M01]